MKEQKPGILIVGNHPSGSHLFASILGNNEFKLVYKVNGSEALEFIKHNSPDLIILNASLPDIDRCEFSARLNADLKSSQIPVLYVAKIEEVEEINLDDAGAYDFIFEPFQPKVVSARIRNYLELKRCRDLLENSVSTDFLTGIANLRTFNEMIDREWRRAIRCQVPQSMIMMDIDYFTAFNGRYGRVAGDNCLRRIATTLINCAKRETDYVARIGGDEFACLLPETDINGAVQVAKKIEEAIDDLNIAHESSPAADHVTLSIGVANLNPTARATSALLVQKANQFLYEARQNGHNQIRSWQG